MILRYPNFNLRSRSEAVSIFNQELESIEEIMRKTMLKERGIGLAAPQIDIHIRLAIFDPLVVVTLDGRPVPAMVNPMIRHRSPDMVTGQEGCLSFPELFINIRRPSRIEVQWQDLQGVIESGEFTGLAARCIQHEIDHLDGVLMIDKVPGALRGPALAKYKNLRERRERAERDAVKGASAVVRKSPTR